MRQRISPFWAWIAAGVLTGCSSMDPRILGDADSQMKLRSVQSREFDSGDTGKTLKVVVATLQDLGFVVDKADSALGVASGTKVTSAITTSTSAMSMALYGFSGRSSAAGTPRHGALRITVTVRARSESQLIVRANAEVEQQSVSDPQQYQQFFAALEKAMFLTAHQVD